MTEWNAQERELCMKVKEMVEAPEFSTVCKRLAEQYVKEWSIADTTDTRERIWHKQNALTDLISEMRTMAGRPAHEEKMSKLRNGSK